MSNLEQSNADDRIGRRSFSLAILIRVVTLTATALGWLLLLTRATPDVMVYVVLLIGLVLGLIVGVRRNGSGFAKLRATAGFWIGTVMLSFYSMVATLTVQFQPNPNDPHGLDFNFYGFSLVPLTPGVVLIAILMFRAWTWSAHDSSDNF